MRIYTAHFKSVINYAGFAWQPSLAKTHVDALERQQNRALRIVTGHTRTTPVEALYLETGEPNIRTVIDRNIISAAEKCLRLPDDHPRNIAYTNTLPHKGLKRQNWGTRARQLQSKLPAETVHRKPLIYFEHPPWLHCPTIEVYTSLPGITSKNDNEVKIIEAALSQIRSFNPSMTLYTDGSASAGTHDGGAGIVTTTGDPSDITITSITRCKGSKFTSSYEEELCAMETAAEIIAQTATDTDTVVIGTDSQSLCMALLNLNRDTDNIRANLARTKAKTIIQWIPGHSNIPGNEAADSAAKEAANLPDQFRPVSFRSICSLIKERICDSGPKHERLGKVYSCYSAAKEKEITSRTEQVDLARIRAGHHTKFHAYQHRLDESNDPSCPRCQAAIHDVEHWFLHCPGTEAAKHEIFGNEANDGLGLLTKCPRKSITLARRTLLGVKQD